MNRGDAVATVVDLLTDLAPEDLSDREAEAIDRLRRDAHRDPNYGTFEVVRNRGSIGPVAWKPLRPAIEMNESLF